MKSHLTEQQQMIQLLAANNIRSRLFDSGDVEVIGEAVRDCTKYPRQVFLKDYQEAVQFVANHIK